MTQEPPPTQVDDVVVRGRRRWPNGQFPVRSGEGYGEDPDGPIPIEVGQEPDPPTSTDPCADPTTAAIWNADAAAAASVAAMIAKAGSLGDGSTLTNREFGVNLIVNATGGVSFTEVSVGPTAVVGQVPNVEIQPGGATLLNWMGDVHNHPSGDGRLSEEELGLFQERLDLIEQYHPERDLSAIAAYVVVADGSSPTGYRIYATTRDTVVDGPVAEVNPEAQPCP